MGTKLKINNVNFKNSTNKLQLWNKGLIIVQNRTGWCRGERNNTRLSLHAANGGIFIPQGGQIIIEGLLKGAQPLQADYVYYNTNEIPMTYLANEDIAQSTLNAVGTCSNYNSSNYFPLNSSGESDSIIISNTYGNDYYFAPVFRSVNGTNYIILSEDYNLTWRYS